MLAKQSLRFCVTVCVTGLKRRELQTTVDSLSAVFKTPQILIWIEHFSSESDGVRKAHVVMARGLPVRPVYLLVEDETHCVGSLAR